MPSAYFKCLILAFLLLTSLSCQNKKLKALNLNATNLSTNAPEFMESPYVILISVDGMRHDYIEKFSPPNLSAFKKNGLSSQSFIPVFPSQTFPNHYSIVTGLLPKNHNLIANEFINVKTGERYQIKDRDKVQDGKWYEGEPLWLLAKHQGMISASYFWVGSDAPIHGDFPNYYKVYDTKVPHDQRVAQVLQWLQMPKENRPHFLTLYYSTVDSAGHEFGPDSKEVKEALLEVDRSLGELFQGLASLEKTGVKANVILVSDHGMKKIEPDMVVSFPEDLLKEDYQITGRGAFSMIYAPSPLKTRHALELLINVPNIKAYAREKAPAHLQFQNSMAGDIIIVAKPGAYLEVKGSKKTSGGTHGYDPKFTPEMGGIFVARGPNIKKGKIAAFNNIDLYPFVAKILGLEITAPIDGKAKTLSPYFLP